MYNANRPKLSELPSPAQLLRSTLPAINRYYAFWTTPPHLIESIGLSRYYDLGDGPAPEAPATRSANAPAIKVSV